MGIKGLREQQNALEMQIQIYPYLSSSSKAEKQNSTSHVSTLQGRFALEPSTKGVLL